MKGLLTLIGAVAIAAASLGASEAARVDDAVVAGVAMPRTLSEFGFFDGAPDRPNSRLIPYTLHTPLFSDYAQKARFIYLPAGTQMRANGDGLVTFPVGAAIIKSFGFTLPDGRYRTIETRVLLHRASGWVALPYIWREDGSDADLRLAGGRMPVTMVDAGGRSRTISYAVPNRNQCRTCHQHDEQLTPIGPKLRNMEMDAAAQAQVEGTDWRTLLALPTWDRPDSGSLAARARAYLDVNCAHCHNPHGSASNSGLFLEYERPDSMATGLWKRPVAAGRGSGGLSYAIEPGHPQRSFLPYRMHSTDPGIAMPELGRGIIHDEGVALINDWIAAMPEGTPPTGAAP